MYHVLRLRTMAHIGQHVAAACGEPGTPTVIVHRLDTVFTEVVRLPALKDKLLAQGFEPATVGHRDFEKALEEEIAKWRKLIKDAGAKSQ